MIEQILYLVFGLMTKNNEPLQLYEKNCIYSEN
jgi:hypothetical protein